MQPSLFDYARLDDARLDDARRVHREPNTPASPPAPDSSNDYHVLPVSEKQVHYARRIAQALREELPTDVLGDRARLSKWIDTHKQRAPQSPFSNYPSSKQVAFAERIARIKHRQVPHECFRDRVMMSKWIDSNR